MPAKPNPECISKDLASEKTTPPKAATKGVTPEVRARAFTRWDTNKDDILALDEYQAGLKGQDDLEARFKTFDANSDGN